MDGKARFLNGTFVEPLWRSLKIIRILSNDRGVDQIIKKAVAAKRVRPNTEETFRMYSSVFQGRIGMTSFQSRFALFT